MLLTVILWASGVVTLVAAFNLLTGLMNGAPERLLKYDFDAAMVGSAVALVATVLKLAERVL